MCYWFSRYRSTLTEWKKAVMMVFRRRGYRAGHIQFHELYTSADRARPAATWHFIADTAMSILCVKGPPPCNNDWTPYQRARSDQVHQQALTDLTQPAGGHQGGKWNHHRMLIRLILTLNERQWVDSTCNYQLLLYGVDADEPFFHRLPACTLPSSFYAPNTLPRGK